jgi:nucleoid DNA-binding protein
MNKSELIRATYEKMDKKIPLIKIEECLNGILDVMTESLKNGEEIQLGDLVKIKIPLKEKST